MISEKGAETSPVLVARNLSIRFEHVSILQDINITVSPGDSLAVIGGSHSGKSVLLRALAGLMKPAQGSVLFRGRPVQSFDSLSTPWEHAMGYVSQNLGLRSNMSALANTALPLIYHGTLSTQAANEKSGRLLRELGVVDVESRPDMMPPGERALVALARALILDPVLLLLDNPVVVMDVDYSPRVIDLLQNLRGRKGLAVVCVCSSATVAKLISVRMKRLRHGRLEDLQ